MTVCRGDHWGHERGGIHSDQQWYHRRWLLLLLLLLLWWWIGSWFRRGYERP